MAFSVKEWIQTNKQVCIWSAFFLLLYLLRGLFGLVFLTFILCYLFNNIIEWLSVRTRGHRRLLTIGLYLLAAVLMKPRPVIPIENEAEQECYDSYTSSPGNAARRLKQRFEKLERRIRRIEDTVTAKEFDWEKRLGE